MKKNKSYKLNLRGAFPTKKNKQSKATQGYLPTLGEPPLRKALQKSGKLCGRAWRTFRSFLAAVALVAGVLFFWPNVDVFPALNYERFDDPSQAPLSVVNKSFIPIRPSEVMCYIEQLTTEQRFKVELIAYDYEAGIGVLKHDETVDFVPDPPLSIPSKTTSADFLVILRYQMELWGMPLWKTDKRVRFHISYSDGKAVWLHRYLTESDRTFEPLTKFIRGKARKQNPL